MKNFFSFLFFLIFTACSTGVEPIYYGKEACASCKMTILNRKFGAEIITKKGKIFKFDDLVCMIDFIHSNAVSKGDIDRLLVIDFMKENNLIQAEQAYYYVGDNLHSPMNGNSAAFLTLQEAQIFQSNKTGIIKSWSELNLQSK